MVLPHIELISEEMSCACIKAISTEATEELVASALTGALQKTKAEAREIQPPIECAMKKMDVTYLARTYLPYMSPLHRF